MSALSKGRRVHYVYNGECYIADVVKIWTAPMVNLIVTLDGSNDSALGGSNTVFQVWKTSINQDDINKESNTWHWPERVGD